MKKICIVLLASLACLFAVSCDKEETNDAPVCSAKRFKLRAPQFADASGSKVYLQFTDAASSLIYEDGDIIYINGHKCTLENDHNTWYANCSEKIVGSRFLAVYADGTINPASFDSTAGTYQYNLTTNLTSPAHNKIVLGGVADTLHEGDYVITLKPACAILRINTQGAGSNWTYAKVGFEGNKIPKAGTINVSNRVIDAGGVSNYMTGVAQGGIGDFLYMRYSDPSTTGQSDYWYVAIPIEGDDVTTTLYLEWNNGSEVVQYKTQGPVTMQKGYVYTLGTGRTSPFYDNGSTKSRFLVANGRYVRFSAGNLQYLPVEDAYGNYSIKWRFAGHQYEVAGDDNTTIVNGEGNDTWIDLFGWGTSGWSSGAEDFMPYSFGGLTAYDHYYPGGNYSNNLTGSYANADWGVYATAQLNLYYGSSLAVGAGAGNPNWSTLTKDEWDYLLTGRTNAANKCGLATINGAYKGLVLIPDNKVGGGAWVLPDGCSFTPGFASGYSTNSYTFAQWDAMENMGAVFIPVTGYRGGSDGLTMQGSSDGYYWTTTAKDAYNAYVMKINGTSATTTGQMRQYGCAVRLVRR